MDNLLYFIKPIADYIPYVEKPIKKLKPNEKLVWTGMVLFIYLIYSQIPLYGIYKTQEADPLHYMRVILASSKNTLAELGISPIIFSSYIIGFLRTFHLIKFDPNIKEEKYLYNITVKFMAIILIFGQSIAFVFQGMYGPVNLIGPFKIFLIIAQLVIGGVIIIILDEILSNGYGLISGISLFVSTNISENLLMKCFSPFTLSSDKGVEYEGAIIALFHFLITKRNIFEALKLAFFRKSAPNLFQLLLTFIILLLVIYLWKFKLELKIIRKTSPGELHSMKIKLFYTSTTPLIIMNFLFSHIYLVSLNLYLKYNNSFIIKLLGTWALKDGKHVPVNGLAYYLTPPKDPYEFIIQPFKNLVYVFIILYSSGKMIQLMCESTGKGAIDIAREFRKEGIFFSDIRENEEGVYERLKKIIPVVCFLSGMIISGIQILADVFRAFGSGTGLLIMVSNIITVQENIDEEENKGNVKIFLEE